MRLPIYLIPRRGSQIFPLLLFGFVFGFAVFWTAAAILISSLNDAPGTNPLFRWLFPICGIPFLLIGLGGLVVAVLKTRPGSPYHYVMLGANQIELRTLFKHRSFDWSKISLFQPQRSIEGEDGSVRYYVVAGEALRIPAREFGSGEGEISAAALADWLNAVRAQERQGNLHDGDTIEVPAELRDHILSIGMPIPHTPSSRAQTVNRR